MSNEFIRLVSALRDSLHKIEKKNIALGDKADVADFGSTERKYILDMYKFNFDKVVSAGKHADGDVRILASQLDFNNTNENKKIVAQLMEHTDVDVQPDRRIQLGKIPDEIRDEVKADLDELEKCMKSGCYRSVVILCGRVIEVCLHAKYYRVTGFDILDKNPGIGLGKLIAKMDEKGIKLDPGLAQQIHLVNNVRIFSVHKKQRTFLPSKQQTEAIILYTMDVVSKLF